MNQRRKNLKKKKNDLTDFFNMINTFILFGIVLVIFAPICWLWVGDLDDIQKNHPDYKGNDLFGEDK